MVRFLICGDLRGQLPKLCEHISKLHARLDAAQHFKVVFCVGEFSTQDMEFSVEPPIPIYFIDCGPRAQSLIDSAPDGKEVSKGVHFLGRYGVCKVAGLSVAYLCGRRRTVEDVDAMAQALAAEPGRGPSWEEIRAVEKKQAFERTQEFIDGGYTSIAIEKLKEQIDESGGVDLLLTSEWPDHMLRGMKDAWPEEAAVRRKVRNAARSCSSAEVAQIAATAEPKYHVVGLGGLFWRRTPWRHERRGEVVASTGEIHGGVCRLIAMGASDGSSPGLVSTQAKGPSATPASSTSAGSEGGKAEKPEKWLHGLDLDPEAMPAPSEDSTMSPWCEKAIAIEAAQAEAAAKEAAIPARISSDAMDDEERRRWKARFGCLPEEMQRLSDKITEENQPKEKKQHHKSLYKVSEKEKKRRKTGTDSHLPFAARERMQGR
mmetsp:Transcript_23412/g.54485  ORF Transcript_23412/g.54485 Transcript_23412/m.54485 type:complete len:431 (-) Transcript_23412:86-1378(-)